MIAQLKKDEQNATQPCPIAPRREGSSIAVQVLATKSIYTPVFEDVIYTSFNANMVLIYAYAFDCSLLIP